MSRVAVVLNTGGADRCDGCSQLGESFRSVVESSNLAKCGKNSKNAIIRAFGGPWVLLGSIPYHLKRFGQFRVFSFFSILEFWLGRAHRRGFLA